MDEYWKVMLSFYIVIMIITTIPNLLYLYRRYVTKQWTNITGAGFGHFMCLYIFVIANTFMLTRVIYLHL